MATVKKQRNYRKRTNYVIAVGMLILFYAWLGHYVYSPGDSPSVERTAPDSAGAGNRVTPRSHGLVAGFRKDIPICTPSRVRTCHVADPEVKAGAVLRSAKSLEQVARFYRSAMVENGWKLKEATSPGDTGKAGSIVLFRGEKAGSLLNVQLNGDMEGTDIRLQLLPKPAETAEKTPSS